MLHCDACGAALDRKQNGAALAFQYADANREEVVTQFWIEAGERAEKKKTDQAVRLVKMAQGRRDARTRSEAETGA